LEISSKDANQYFHSDAFINEYKKKKMIRLSMYDEQKKVKKNPKVRRKGG
jgi:hypothetical protein